MCVTHVHVDDCTYDGEAKHNATMVVLPQYRLSEVSVKLH
jgi:hypothetical protein